MIFPLLALALLAGCGAESIGAAATVAKSQQEQLLQGEQIRQDVEKKLNAAAQLEQQRLDESKVGPY
jgi:uncharacterized lipoprotein YajG